MNMKQLEAMLRIMFVAKLVMDNAIGRGAFGTADAIRQDLRILSEYGADVSATTQEEKFRNAQHGIEDSTNWEKLVKDLNKQ